MAGHPDDDYDRDILDIIPERFDADADSYQARSGSRLRNWLLLGVAVAAIGGIVAGVLHFVGGSKDGGNGIPVISADQRPIKIRPDDRGGMQVPNQDKLVYGRLDQTGADAGVERLLPKPEQPMSPAVVPPAAPPAVVQDKLAPAVKAPEPIAIAKPPATIIAPPPVPPIAVAKPPAPIAPPPVVQSKSKTAPAPVTETMPAKVAAASAPVHSPPPVMTSGAYLVQLGALRSAPDAEKEWSRIQHANAELLGNLKSDVVQVDLGAKGVFWRLRAGPLSEQSARQMCVDLKARNQGCMIVRK